MAITDIPEFVELAPGGLIRSEDWNNIQRQVRNSVRSHRHTRAANAPPNDADSADQALQITTSEIADGAVTASKLGLADGSIAAAKLADNSVTGAKLADGAVGNAKLADGSINAQKLQANSVARANIQDNAVNRSKLLLQEIASGNNQAVPTGTTGVLLTVLANMPNAQVRDTPFFPTLTITSLTGTPPSGANAEIEAFIVYRKTPTSTGDTTDVHLRLRNNGNMAATVNWRVLRFAP